MLAHYAANTLGQVRRSPLAAAIRVLTLAVGLACFIAAHAITGFWQRSERHFANVDRIFSVSTDLAFRDGSLDTGELPLTNEHVASYLETDYPGLAAVARARVIGEAAMVSADDRAVRLFRVDVDPEFLEIFDLPFIAGDSRRALREPGSVVLTEEAAEKLFGEKPALGRRVRLSNSVDALVTGVIAAIPEPSHMGRSATASLRFDLLASRDLSQPPAGADARAAAENWLVLDTATYILLPADGSLTAKRLDGELAAFAGRHVPREQLAFAQLAFGLVPVAELLVRSGSSGVFLARTGLPVTTALSLLGALVLAVACANYGNLAAATALAFSHEVAVRKVMGATPLQIAGQYLLDASMFTCAGFVAALVAVLVMVPMLEAAIGIDLRIVLDGASLAFLAALLAIVSALGGLYPALVLARQPPVARLPSRGARERRASNVLVAAQFAAASFLLLAAIVTYLQSAALKRNLQAAPDPLVIIENFHTATRLHPDTLRRELAALAHSYGVTGMARPPWTGVNVLPLGTSPSDAKIQRSAIWHTVGQDFFSMFDIELLAGRVFDGARGDDALPFLGDPRRPNNIVIDRTLAQELGFPSVQAAVDSVVYVPRELAAGFGGSAAQPLRVIGVVAARPLTLAGAGARGSVYSFADPLPFQVVRIARTHVAEALAEIDAVWKRLVPNVALRRRLADEIFAEKYAGHERVDRALVALALFAYAISAIGLFSMAKVAARRRVREIAVRKVLGATTTAVAMLMLASFARPIIVANVVAWPAAYFAARAYLAGFVEPIPLTVFPFLLCLVMTVSVVGVTVFAETLRAARARPCAVLQHE
jgi:putative ABC transport system permease protein